MSGAPERPDADRAGDPAVPDPEAVVAALRGRGPLLWLDGASDVDGLGRWSHIGVDPAGAVLAHGDRVLHLERQPAGEGRPDGWTCRLERGDPFAALEGRLDRLARGRPPRPPGDPRPLVAGGIGWLGYELGRQVERLPRPADDRALVPDLAVWLFDDVLGFDRAEGRWWGGTPRARAAVARPGPLAPLPPPPAPRLGRDLGRDDYLERVERIRQGIGAGEVYQVNLSQRFRGPIAEDPFTLYRRLRRSRPAPLGAYFEAGPRAVLSNSPELFLERRGERVETRPIKGTRPRGTDPEEDRRLGAELEASEKDRAELTMIVDLMRNDLGRLARPGTVRVRSLARRVELPTVHHLVATVEARLEAGTGLAALLRATFPPGSVTGCPKVRAMEWIASLEPCRRGVYTGAIGWLGADGDLSLNVAIRTLTVARGRLAFHSGGGVVIDSEAAAEHDETLAKARAFAEALGSDPAEAEVAVAQGETGVDKDRART